MTINSKYGPPAPLPFSNNVTMNARAPIVIKVLRPDGSTINFSVNMNTRLGRVKREYCIRSDLPEDRVRLMFYGAEVNRLDTPESLQMEDGDEIDAFHLCNLNGNFMVLSNL